MTSDPKCQGYWESEVRYDNTCLYGKSIQVYSKLLEIIFASQLKGVGLKH